MNVTRCTRRKGFPIFIIAVWILAGLLILPAWADDTVYKAQALLPLGGPALLGHHGRQVRKGVQQGLQRPPADRGLSPGPALLHRADRTGPEPGAGGHGRRARRAPHAGGQELLPDGHAVLLRRVSAEARLLGDNGHRPQVLGGRPEKAGDQGPVLHPRRSHVLLQHGTSPGHGGVLQGAQGSHPDRHGAVQLRRAGGSTSSRSPRPRFTRPSRAE